MREKGVHSRLSESANKDAKRQNSEKLRVTEALWVRVRALPSDLLCQGSWNCFLSFFLTNICFESIATKLISVILVLKIMKNLVFDSKTDMQF